jgi:hypothetical protein
MGEETTATVLEARKQWDKEFGRTEKPKGNDIESPPAKYSSQRATKNLSQ